jgi:pimeloyl-ACP methyl ester carboxylesterase
VFRSDFPFWLLRNLAGSRLDAMLDVTPELRVRLAPEEREMVTRMVEAIQRVTARLAGLQNEGAAIDPLVRYPLEKISAPSLVLHARDDRIDSFGFGEYTAQHITGAEFVPLS